MITEFLTSYLEQCEIFRDDKNDISFNVSTPG